MCDFRPVMNEDFATSSSKPKQARRRALDRAYAMERRFRRRAFRRSRSEWPVLRQGRRAFDHREPRRRTAVGAPA